MQKRILITLKDISERGGGERVGVNLANAFARDLNYKVRVVSFFCAHSKPYYALDKGVELFCLCECGAKSKNPLRNLFHKSLFRFWLSYKMHKFTQDADIVLANDGWFVPFLKDKGRFFVRLWHLNAPKKARKKLALFDALVILSPRELSLWQKLHNNVCVIPNFLPQIPSQNTDYTQKIVLSIGRMDNGDQKGFLRLLDIWKMVQENVLSLRGEAEAIQTYCHSEGATQPKNPRIKSDFLDSSPMAQNDNVANDLNQWKLIIVGNGVLKSEIESKIRALNLQDSVLLKPFTKDIESEYLSASIYAMSSHFEGFGMVLAEASSYALPCIAFDVATGPSDIIENNKSGFLIANDDLQEYANKLIALMSDKKLRAQFGNKAKRLVGESFGKEAVLGLWKNLFEKG